MEKKSRSRLHYLAELRLACATGLHVASLAAFAAVVASAQVSVRSTPPAVLVESTGTVSLTAQVSGTLPGETTATRWSLNDQAVSDSRTLSFSPANGPSGVPLILKATSVFDPSKFAAVPVVSLQKSTLAQVGFPETVAYHGATGKIYVAALVSRPPTVDTNLIEVSPDGTQTPVLTLSGEIVDKLLPYSLGGTSYLLAVGFLGNAVHAVNLASRTTRRVVAGLVSPVSAAIDPLSGNLYVAEQNARRISVVSRSALDFALGGTSTAPFQALPITIPGVSGVGFLADRETKKVSLLATSTSGAIYKVSLEDNAFAVVAAGLLSASQELLVAESPQLGFSFVLVGNSSTTDGQGRVSAFLPAGGDQPFGSPYSVATGLDTVTDLAFVPADTAYSSRALIVASNLSATASRGRILTWEVDPSVAASFYAYNDQARPSLNFISPAPDTTLSPGAPVELRWTVTEINLTNPFNAHFPAPAEVLISTDGGNSFASTGTAYTPSGPMGNEYKLLFQVPANWGGLRVRLRVQTRGLGGALLAATSGDLSILPQSEGLPQVLSLNPDFIVAGESARITVEGLNFRSGTGINFEDGVPVNSASLVSSSRLMTDITAAALSDPGPISVVVCDAAGCSSTENAFFVLPPSGPRITSLQPQSGSPGTTITIAGANFSPVAANNIVTFGALRATVSQAQPGALVAQVPFGVNWAKLPLAVHINGFSSNTADFFLTPPGFLFPALNRDGIVNSASVIPGDSPLAAGSLASIFGVGLAPSISGTFPPPLPREVLGTSVMIGGVQAPLLFAAPNQVNVQVPEEVRGLNSVPVTFFSRGIPGNTVLLNLAQQNPGLFSADSSGRGLGAILNQDGSQHGPGNPERIGRVLQVFATGLGASSPSVDTGAAAPRDTLSNHVVQPQATIDGKPASVIFSGRAPDWSGLDQVNVVIPDGVATGAQIPLVITVDGKVSNAVTVLVAP